MLAVASVLITLAAAAGSNGRFCNSAAVIPLEKVFPEN